MKEESADILKAHDQHVKATSPRLKAIRDAMCDHYWTQGDQTTALRASGRPLFEVNRLQPWKESYEGSLTYGEVVSIVEPDELIENDAELPDPAPTKKLLDRLYRTRPFVAVSSMAISLLLSYGTTAYRVYLDTDRRPLDAIRIEALPQWECVWDRQVRSRERSRYWGHVRWMSKEDVKREFNYIPATLYCAPDTLAQGDAATTASTTNESGVTSDRNYVRIFEVWYPSSKKHCVYDVSSGKHEEILEETISELHPDGSPVIPVIPIVSCTTPEFPLDGLSRAQKVYQLVERANFIGVWLAQRAKKDAAMTGLYRADSFNDVEIAKVNAGEDVMLKFEGEGSLEGAISWLKSPNIPPTLLELYRFTEAAFDQTNSLAPSTQGEVTKYASATSDARANDYTETNIGMIRQVLDIAAADVGKVYLAYMARLLEHRADKAVKSELAAALVLNREHDVSDDIDEEVRVATPTVKDILAVTKIVVRINQENVEVPYEHFKHAWNITIADAANTPQRAERERADLANAAPQLVALATTATTSGTPPEVAAVCRKLYDLYVARFRMPRDMAWSAIAGTGGAPVLPAPAPPPAVADPGAIPVAAGPAGEQAATGAVGLPIGGGGPGSPAGAPSDAELMMQGDQAAAAALR